MADRIDDFGSDASGSWSGPRVLVPITLQALVVTQSTADAEWSVVPTSYSNMRRFMPPVEPEPFTLKGLSNADGTPWTGVVLHWTLPDALTHGTPPSASSPSSGSSSPPGSDIEYPLIPNRWLVLRVSHPPDPNDPNARQTRAWIVESDYLDTVTTNGATNEFWDPVAESLTYLGRSSALEEWLQNWQPNVGGANSFPLQAIGPGDATYSAYIANLNNVLSFQDDLQDLGQEIYDPPLPLTYMVFGWYADPTTDPLYNAQTKTDWNTLIDQFDWSYDDTGVYPNQILCHAMTYNVPWVGAGGQSTTGPPTGMPLVAVGNTSVEALAALIEQQICLQAAQPTPCLQGENVAEILETFQYNLLQLWDQPSGQVLVDQQRHQASFGSVPGGTIWDAVPTPAPNPPPPPASPYQGPQPPLALSPQQLAALKQLNALQEEFDQRQRAFTSQQWDLYALWWLSKYCTQPLNHKRDYLQTVQDALTQLVQPASEAQTWLAQTAEAIENLKAQLTTLLGDTFQLLSAKPQRYWQPVDPVVLICGAKGSYKHGAAGHLSDDGSLPCRVTGDTVTSIAVSANNTQATVTAASLAAGIPIDGAALSTLLASVPAPLSDLFNNIVALYGESLLLDTTEAASIAQLAFPPVNSALIASIQQQQTVFWNSIVYPSIDKHAAATASGFNGQIPYVISLAPWTPPWSPLFMDWQVQWVPSFQWILPGQPAPNPSQALSGWTFDDLDYDWTSTQQPNWQDQTASYQLQGRTLLTPQAAGGFAARLEQLLYQTSQGTASDPGQDPTEYYSPPPDVASALGEVLQMINQWDLLSQSMSGFNQQLLQHDPTQHIFCKDPVIGPLVGGGSHARPLPDAGSSQVNGFNPIRAGHFVITGLWIVDDFGQVFDVQAAVSNQSQILQVTAISDWLTTPGVPWMMQLPPRVVQPTRLSFMFVSSSDDEAETALAPDANPVCGWVLPNHLNDSLAIYDTSGAALGELQLVGGSQNQHVRWTPVPDSPAPVGAPPDISNLHLRSFIEGILDQPDAAAALGQLMAVIDETLWTIDPLGARHDQSLSVLIGRPLALVRSRLKLQLNGEPVYDQSWAAVNSGQGVVTQNTAGFTETVFPVRLGSLEIPEDGLLGYFDGNNYQQFNALHLPSGTATSPSSYVVQSNIELQLESDLTSPPNANAVYVTLLLDPRGVVHASSGILPVQKVSVPATYVDQALARMEVTFLTGPLLTATEKLKMPVPATTKGNWSWLQHTGVTVWQENTTIVKADSTAVLSDIPLSLREGWLKLKGSLADNDQKTD
ncbi:MAG: hypothetical protein QOD75_1890 [Blastocatellia bacterium]|jgi:hypothetical protein|nr:hypothetical protein [Blastocatellia bacterium]